MIVTHTLRTPIDEGDQAYAEGRTPTIDDPAAFSKDLIARGRHGALIILAFMDLDSRNTWLACGQPSFSGERWIR
jgi:hypothetical protein